MLWVAESAHGPRYHVGAGGNNLTGSDCGVKCCAEEDSNSLSSSELQRAKEGNRPTEAEDNFPALRRLQLSGKVEGEPCPAPGQGERA